MNARIPLRSIRDDRSHETPHSAVLPAGYALQAHPPGGPPCPRLSGTASLPSACGKPLPSPRRTERAHSALAWPLIPHGATRRAPPGARRGLPECPGGPVHGKTARHSWPAEEPDGSRLIFRGPVSGRLASSRRKAPAHRAAHRRPLDCSRPGLVRARVRLRLTPARV